MADQLIVNEYEPGQGISKHVDVVTSFADGIASLTLGSGCAMTFAEVGGAGKVDVLLPARSLIVLQGPARYGWTHAIAKRKTDRFAGRVIPRKRRVSLTFRQVIQV